MCDANKYDKRRYPSLKLSYGTINLSLSFSKCIHEILLQTFSQGNLFSFSLVCGYLRTLKKLKIIEGVINHLRSVLFIRFIYNSSPKNFLEITNKNYSVTTKHYRFHLKISVTDLHVTNSVAVLVIISLISFSFLRR